MHDLVIRGGSVVDGTGAPARTADVAIDSGRVSEVGRVTGAARRTIDADGLLVTPGFVDIHTHYDAQATWDPHLTPSCWHGVTTVVAGNCGVGFAPAAPERHQWLIGLMEGVEDIPGSALSEGIRWDWESFPEYLDALERAPHALDVGTQVPHGAVRAYVMGERGAKNEPATADDIAGMAQIVKEGLLAGALGFSSSRTMGHKAIDGEPVPGSFAREDELFGIGRALEAAGQGVFELAPAGAGGDAGMDGPESILEEMEWAVRLSAAIRRPVSFVMLQYPSRPEIWRDVFRRADEAATQGAEIFPQVAGRPFGILVGHQTIANPFLGRPSYVALLPLPLPERARRLRDPETRRRILSERVDRRLNFFLSEQTFENLFPLGDPPDYEPASEQSIASLARREGRPALEVVYDLMLERRRPGAAALPVHELLRGEPRTAARDDAAPARDPRPRRRRRALRLDLRREHPDLHAAHWVRDRTRGDEDAARARGAPKAHAHDRAALRAARPRRDGAGLQGRPELIDFDARRSSARRWPSICRGARAA